MVFVPVCAGVASLVGLGIPSTVLPSTLLDGKVASKPLLAGLGAACITYAFAKYFGVGPRHPQLTQVPPRCKPGLNRYLFQNAGDLAEFSPYNAFLHWGTKLDSETHFMNFAGQSRIVTSNPDDMIYVFEQDEVFLKGRGFKLLKRFLGKGLLTIIPSEEHKAHRRIVGPAFSPKALRHLANVCVPVHAAQLVESLRKKVSSNAAADSKGGEQTAVLKDVQDHLDKATFAIVAQAAFKIEAQNEEEITRCRNIFSTALKTTFTFPRLHPVVEALGFYANYKTAQERKKILEIVNANLAKVIAAKDTDKVAEEERADALIDYLVHSKQLSQVQMADHSIVFLGAGFETTSTALGWALYVLAKNPEVQAKLFEEMSSAISLGSTATMDDVQGCKYLACFVKEVLRLHSPAGLVARHVEADVVLPSGTFVPGGIHVVMPGFAMQQSPKHWGPDAAEFRPERWEEPGLEARVTNYCYMPFNVGRRNCIGKDFALNELHLMLAVLSRNLTFAWPEDEPEPERFVNVTIRPKNPMRLVVGNRPQ